jgi:hypothetical protein
LSKIAGAPSGASAYFPHTVMNRFRPLCFVVLALLAVSCASETDTTVPTVTVSLTRVPSQGWVDVEGAGFTPAANVTSHLEQPDGTEFPYLPILTDAEGAFTHEIDTLLLMVGTHRLWVVDDTTGVSSNVAEFEVTREQPPAG